MTDDADFSNRAFANNSRPRLLVSVRNAEEARAAIAGGCDILDVKEPAHGSLGMADVETISNVARHATAGLPLSTALGETTDWLDRETPPVLPRELDYVKLGTAGLADRPAGLGDWLDVRERFDTANPSGPRWIAVGYADAQRASAPKPRDVLHAAIETSCAGLLIDTFAKDGRGLLDWMSIAELTEFSGAVHRAGLLFAVAGSLCVDNLPTVRQCRPDVIAVRSAACDRGARRGPVTIAATRSVRKALDRCCGMDDAPTCAGGASPPQ